MPGSRCTPVAGVQRVLGGLFDIFGRVEVRFPDREVDDVDAVGRQFGGLVADRERGARFYASDAVCESRVMI